MPLFLSSLHPAHRVVLPLSGRRDGVSVQIDNFRQADAQDTDPVGQRGGVSFVVMPMDDQPHVHRSRQLINGPEAVPGRARCLVRDEHIRPSIPKVFVVFPKIDARWRRGTPPRQRSVGRIMAR